MRRNGGSQYLVFLPPAGLSEYEESYLESVPK
ncbi:hypothetical protein A2U01_0075390, partial [Trifolium medium]|nr:hypothetical protein [Trifolium medium]